MRRKENITLNSKILISHFTGKEKIITLNFIILMLSFVNIMLCFSSNSVSALSYESEVGVGFTFNPTLSVSLSSSDLIISNLTPGSSANSNSINVSVATNASYGYTLSATLGDNTYDNNNLNHSNNTDIFSSIATNANLSSLDTDNTWGYSTSLDSGTSWNNYNGLSSSISTTLLDTNSNNTLNNGVDSIGFKIGAKAGNTQASGTYTNTITFTAVTKPTPMNLAESYFAAGKTRYKGYYTMQDMTTEICTNTEVIGEGSQTQLIDIRDDKVYWATKLADNHCWMTQNLDLDLDSTRTYTHWDTDLGWSTEDNNIIDESATWQPMRSTINFTIGSAITGWQSYAYTSPFSANPGDVYFYTSNSDTDDIQYSSLQECASAGHNDCTHYHAGNYYNWSAAVASNDTSGLVEQYDQAPNSICPSSWRLPIAINSDGTVREFGSLLAAQNIIATNSSGSYVNQNGFNTIRTSLLYFNRPGEIRYGNLTGFEYGRYSSSTIKSSTNIHFLGFSKGGLSSIGDYYGNYMRETGLQVRCLAR